MSIVLNLYKQSLITRRNNAQAELFHNNSRKLAMLGGLHYGLGSNLASVSSMESAIDLDNLSLNSELMAINSELGAINGCNINYLS